ncbi:hypothetical protein ETH_00041490 [Eimeria tenella]|uniref:Uncharacterized protein n=1 Tax=Eimeria tenella TaxID=5802 RepID=U6L3P6_EIMTE|nr:hypothetical protein ETH_00041490 [Eimeria tenella]CDJ44791.1 hypothetical protein ETH_00041490 [Eimeria tenella]|eukprot:XP_013235539.1 hypothetical protein ETH_00041490 [Eimeria tenella]
MEKGTKGPPSPSAHREEDSSSSSSSGAGLLAEEWGPHTESFAALSAAGSSSFALSEEMPFQKEEDDVKWASEFLKRQYEGCGLDFGDVPPRPEELGTP